MELICVFLFFPVSLLWWSWINSAWQKSWKRLFPWQDSHVCMHCTGLQFGKQSSIDMQQWQLGFRSAKMQRWIVVVSITIIICFSPDCLCFFQRLVIHCQRSLMAKYITTILTMVSFSCDQGFQRKGLQPIMCIHGMCVSSSCGHFFFASRGFPFTGASTVSTRHSVSTKRKEITEQENVENESSFLLPFVLFWPSVK